MTHKDLTWGSISFIYEEQENAFVGIQGKVICPAAVVRGPLMTINSVVLSTCVEDTEDIMSDDNFGNVLKSHVNISYLSISKAATECSLQLPLQSKKGKKIDSENLAKR